MNKINFTIFPVINTERLSLRQLGINDDVDLMKLRSDESVNKYIRRQKYVSVQETRAFIKKINNGIEKNEWIFWGISLKDSDELIGTICLWNIDKAKRTGEIGFELLPGHQGKGLMKEALKEVLEYGFRKMDLQMIHGVADKNNTNSIKLLEKFDFIQDQDAEKNMKWEVNEEGKMVVYSLAVNS